MSQKLSFAAVVIGALQVKCVDIDAGHIFSTTGSASVECLTLCMLGNFTCLLD